MKFFRLEGSRRRPGVNKKFQKTLILVFEVIVQPPKHTFEIGFFFLRFSILRMALGSYYYRLLNICIRNSSFLYRYVSYYKLFSSWKFQWGPLGGSIDMNLKIFLQYYPVEMRGKIAKSNTVQLHCSIKVKFLFLGGDD